MEILSSGVGRKIHTLFYFNPPSLPQVLCGRGGGGGGGGDGSGRVKYG